MQTQTQAQKEVLYGLEATGNYDFIQLTKIVDAVEPVLVPSKLDSDFKGILTKNGISFSRVLSNRFSLYREKTALVDGKITYDGFYSSELIETSLRNIAKEVTSDKDSLLRAQFFQYGNTFKGQSLNAVRIGLKKNDEEDIPVMIIDGGIHGNEWISPAAAHHIAENLFTNPKALEILEKSDVILTTCVNRDAYDASIKWLYPIIYGRKNLMPSADRNCFLKDSQGTNINRNFDWFWNSTDSKEDPCGYNYRGDYPHSAPETASLVNLMATSRNVIYYHTIHAFGNVILYPYGSSKEPCKYFEENRAVALAGKEAVEKEFKQTYKVGSTYEILYTTSGASKDYANGVANIPISLIHEIGGRTLDFQPLTSDIETYVGMAWTVFSTQAVEVNKLLDRF